MRIFLLACFFLMPISLVHAQSAKPNTLTPDEIKDGWILLFDGETTLGWTGDVQVRDGMLHFDEKTKARSTFMVTGCRVTFDYRIRTPQGKGEAAGVDFDGIRTRLQPLSGFTTTKDGWLRGIWPDAFVETAPQAIVKQGPRYLQWKCTDGATLEVRNVKARPTKVETLFNGKDLAGWKIFPGKKSKFTVEDGAIRIQDGPGDLQTEGKYQNFVFQVEVKSNGKHLNSGVFFRCRDNEYQNGYEAQIRNQFTAEATQEYTLDEYDPKTRKLSGKTKVKSSAVDFGTGAIYRRVPARKEVAKDGEWFTMTVAAQGAHLATWVNGIQQVDWIDNRPISDNARTGCKLEAGHISFQGHDPTTDLSFRNIRIATP